MFAKCTLLFDVIKTCTNTEKIQPDKEKYLKQKAKLLFQEFVNLNLLTFS